MRRVLLSLAIGVCLLCASAPTEAQSFQPRFFVHGIGVMQDTNTHDLLDSRTVPIGQVLVLTDIYIKDDGHTVHLAMERGKKSEQMWGDWIMTTDAIEQHWPNGIVFPAGSRPYIKFSQTPTSPSIFWSGYLLRAASPLAAK